jgi:hypothetical protein
MTQEHEDLLALAAAHLLDPARTGRRLAATVRCYIKDVRPAFRCLAARADLARRPAVTSLVLPAQKITVESGIQREVLRLLAVEGPGRVWRIVERVLDSELTGAPNTARNAVNRLAERGLLATTNSTANPSPGPTRRAALVGSCN